MVDEIVKRKTTALSTEKNFFELYGQAMTARMFPWPFFRFAKGDFLAGQENREVPPGTRLGSLMTGWVRWQNNKPGEHRMGLVAEGFVAERRSELGDHDETLWELDNTDKPRDPWQFTNYLVMREMETGELSVFATGTKGGLDAIGRLSSEHGKHMRQVADEDPVIEIGVDSYLHPNRSLGRIKIPVFKVVDWVPAESLVY